MDNPITESTFKFEFTGDEVHLIKVGIQDAICLLSNHINTCPYPHMHVEEIKELEDRRAQYESLLIHISTVQRDGNGTT